MAHAPDQPVGTLPALLAHWAGARPSAPAVLSAHGALSFAELDERVRACAAGLRALDVGEGSVVGLMCTNRPEWVVATLATVRLGARVAAFNTWAKKWDLEQMLRESGCEVLIALSRFRDTAIEPLLSDLVPEAWQAEVPGWSAAGYPALREIVLIDPSAAAPGVRSFAALAEEGQGRRASDAPAGDDAPILVMYTSGSTARPKAVPIHHRMAVAHGRDVAERMGVAEGDLIWLPVPLFWSYGGANAFMVALASGATLVLQEAFDAAEALDLIETHGCTVAYTLPNITDALLAHADFASDRVRTLAKGMTIGSPRDVQKAADALGISGVCNAYGSTELYGGCCVTPWDWPLERKMRTQGPPLPANEVVIRDPETGAPRPAGEVGEITVRGQVTSGYLGQPEQTEAAFTPEGVFRTGDLGFLDENGDMNFVGRASEMIRTGGINVAPAEVEEFLRTHPAVAEVAVVGAPDAAKDEIVVAVVTLAEGAEPVDEAALRAYCRERIASYKVPARIVLTREPLPRTDTGKLSRNGVREIAADFMADAAGARG